MWICVDGTVGTILGGAKAGKTKIRIYCVNKKIYIQSKETFYQLM